MVDFPGGEEISMKNYDLENNYKEGGQASRNMIEENRIERSEEGSDEVKAHGWCLLPKRTYDSIKEKEDESWREIIDDQTLKQKSPGGNTVLHVAALYGNVDCVERIDEIGGAEILTAKNRNGDTPLHVAARAGHIYTLHKLLTAVLRNPNSEQAKEAILVTNNQGNTLFHEAFLNGHKDVMKILDSSPPDFWKWVVETAFTITNNKDKSVLQLAFEKDYEDIVDQVLFPSTSEVSFRSHSNSDFGYEDEDEDEDEDEYEDVYGILEKIVNEKKEWIHVKDDIGRNALHYAASTGYLYGVEYLLQHCHTCNMEKDNDGFFPLHLASAFGHTKVLKKLLENCPNPREIVDNKGRNIVHISTIMGQFNVVKYILQDTNDEVKDMINDKDCDGNTPLHLAASHSRPKIVQALTWDTKVDLHCLNNNNQTALDVFEQFRQENNPPFPQRLTWCQLKSAGVQYSKRGSHSIKIPNPRKPEANKTDFFKDRINTLMLVSTLITTVAFAAGFTLPGGNNSSSPGKQGMAVMLNHMWFKPFILCITISMYGGIGVTIILLWAQLEDITLAMLALKVAMPLLGVTLATLSVAFLAGVHLVISDLSWLATIVMILCVVFILLLLLLYTLLSFPSESNNIIMRYISFYPFQFLAWLFEDSTEDEMKGSSDD
ncbi:hypothetical protein PHAVU_005G046600 [Phaseolus vulgaris]|uniref:PGG domain-containing protein n=1 Tax=Phaseolus vulgaris TaxID=3885 RepID=V7BX77_PHAVU|nr:hypothetical protein PHAVU_005G046600g [Phaseolus vulgaris]ESW21156.1 hypothetical protein PHAVU_005G046600g [Phaseolus vulgaris]